MIAALDNRSGRNKSYPSLILKLAYRDSTAVAHGTAYLIHRYLNIVMQRAGIRNVGINALLKAELARSALM